MLDIEWDDLEEAFEGLESEITDIVRGLTVSVWDQVLARTPQYWGRMAASWSYSLHLPVFVDRSDLVEINDERGPTRRGDMRAIQIAEAASSRVPQHFRLGDTVYISNGVDHGEGEYAGLVEDGAIQLRAVNLPGKPASRTLDAIKARFGVDMTPAAAASLKNMKIGN